jgi:hypothetical protein
MRFCRRANGGNYAGRHLQSQYGTGGQTSEGL